jgi:hypothetical protein
LHQGQPIKDIPVGYLVWFINNVTTRPDIVALMKRYLNGETSPTPKPSKVITMAGLKRPPAPKVAVPAKVGILEECTQLVKTIYQRAYPIDVLSLSEENQRKYNNWMNTCRMMQSIIDRDNGKALPQSLCDLRVLKGALVGGCD